MNFDPTKLDLLVVDSLQGFERTQALVPEALLPQVSSADAMLRRLAEWQADFVVSQSTATLKAVRADWGSYIEWCQSVQQSPLPASIEQVESFLRNAIVRGRKLSTIRRYLYTISLIHDAAGLLNPTKDRRWKRRWKGLLKNDLKPRGGNVKRQAEQLRAQQVEEVIASMTKGPRDLRDAALLALASDTLLRESELVRVELEHFARDPSTGKWSLLVPFSKTNSTGEDIDYRHVTQRTMDRITTWTSVAKIVRGFVFVPIGGRKRQRVVAAQEAGTEVPVLPLGAQEVARIFRRRAFRAGIDKAGGVSGHSTRVGSANDLINAGYTTAQIQDAGKWKSAEMVISYTRRSSAGRSAMAELRDKQGLSSPEPGK